jgi:hypothetical protein
LPLVFSIIGSTLFPYIAIAILASLIIWFFHVFLIFRYCDVGNRIVEQAQRLLADRRPRPEEQLSQEIGQDESQAIGQDEPDFTAEEISQVSSSFFSGIPSWLLNSLALIVAVVISFVVGTRLLYVPMVSTAYQQLYEAYCRSDGIAEVLSHSAQTRHFPAKTASNGCEKPAGLTTPTDKPPAALTKDEVFILLDSLGLLYPKETNTAALFPEPPPSANDPNATPNHDLAVLLADPSYYSPGQTPTSQLLVRLAGKLGGGYAAGVACVTQDTENGAPTVQAKQLSFMTAGIAAAMAQQPLTGRQTLKPAQPSAVGQPIGRFLLTTAGANLLSAVTGEHTDNCDGDSSLRNSLLGSGYLASSGIFRPLLTRPDDTLTDAEIVDLALAWSDWRNGAGVTATPQQAATIAFMRAIGSAAGATTEVRSARIAVNFFIGWERLAILIVATFLTLCLLWQQLVNLTDSLHLHQIRDTIEKARQHGIAASLPLSILRRTLYRSYGRSAPREILVAALEVAQQQRLKRPVDFDRVRRVGEQELRISDRSRFFFLAGLPLLPTIGFIGTVHSLIEALSLADNIPRARDAVDQVTAVADVTSTLSLCFSTTFMALTALLIFAPLDLWQATSERRIVEEAERLLDPGL